MTNFLGAAGASIATRGKTYTADQNGMVYGVTAGGYDLSDMLAAGFVPVASSPSSNFKNLLDGGDFTINPFQRNIPGLAASNTISAGVTNTAGYFADRWFALGGSSACSIQMAAVADTTVAGFGTSLSWGRFASNTAVSAIYLGQVLESADSVRAQGRELCFSFWARSNTAYSGGALTANVISGTGTNQSAASLQSGWTGAFTVATGAITLTSGMTRYSVAGTVPAGCNQLGVLLSYTPATVTAAAGDTVFFNGAQLELDSAVPTPFEHRDVQVELEICQRYAWVIAEPAATVIVGAGVQTATGAETFYLATPVQLRAAPTVSISAGSFAVGGAGAFNNATITAGSTHTPNAISVKGTGTGTAGQGALLAGFGGTGYIIASADF